MRVISLPLFLAFVAGTGTAWAADATSITQLKDLPIGGEVQCIKLSHIRQKEFVDDQTIIFHLYGGLSFINRLENNCPRLAFEESYIVEPDLDSLCHHTKIRVFDSSPVANKWCFLGKFTRIDPQAAASDEGAKP